MGLLDALALASEFLHDAADTMGLAACTSTEHRCINEQMFFLEAGPAIATLLFAGFVAFFLSWTKNKNFTLRFVQVVAFLFLAWSLASLTATLTR